PEQTGPGFENVGVTASSITTVIVVRLEERRVGGENVYVVVAVLSTAGDHVPLIPLFDVVGNVNEVPEQTGTGFENVGVTASSITTVIVVELAHPPLSGVKVYVVVAVLSTAGDHVPLIPLSDVVGNVNEVPEQTGPGFENVGVTASSITTVIVVELAHPPLSGVKVYVVVAVLSTAGDHVPLIPLFDVVG